MQHLKQIYIFPWYFNANKFSTQELQASQWHLYGAQLTLHQNLSLLQHAPQTTITDTINLRAPLYDIDTSQFFLYMAQKRQRSFYLAKPFLWCSQIFCSLENTSIKEKKTRKPIYWQFSVSQKHSHVFSSIRPQVLLLIQNSTVKFIQNPVNIEWCLMVMSKWLFQTLQQGPLHIFTLTLKTMTSIWANNLQSFIKADQLMFSPKTTSEEE